MSLKEEMLSAAIRARAEELAEADEDMVVDKPSEGALGVGVAVLVSFETLLPLFDGDERRAILYLQHVMGEVLTRPYELAFKTLSEWEHPLDKIDEVSRRGTVLRRRLGHSTTSDPGMNADPNVHNGDPPSRSRSSRRPRP